MARHVNIPVFIPHLGCPNDCVFCNQRKISGTSDYKKEAVYGLIEDALSTISPEDDCELAFFGGSFTGIDRDEMIYLLEIAEGYIRSGRVSSIRLSTRPDYIDGEILDILSRYHVGTIELGMQSMNDAVLSASRRGHTSDDTRRASQMILERGFALVGQMMIGLPMSTPDDEIMTARAVVSLGCNAARVYPTAVFSGTELASMAASGVYLPLTVEDAVLRCAPVLDILERAGVKLLRVGLCEGEGLHEDDGIIAGGYHEAIGELAFGEMMKNRIEAELRNHSESELVGAPVEIEAAHGMTSKIIGHKGRNRDYFCKKYGILGLKVRERAELSGYAIKINVRK